MPRRVELPIGEQLIAPGRVDPKSIEFQRAVYTTAAFATTARTAGGLILTQLTRPEMLVEYGALDPARRGFIKSASNKGGYQRVSKAAKQEQNPSLGTPLQGTLGFITAQLADVRTDLNTFLAKYDRRALDLSDPTDGRVLPTDPDHALDVLAERWGSLAKTPPGDNPEMLGMLAGRVIDFTLPIELTNIENALARSVSID